MIRHTIERVYMPHSSEGMWRDHDGVILCKTLELPWRNNNRGVSCIPEGVYQITKEPPIPKNDPKGRRERPYWHFRIHNVPGRSGILVHLITFVKDLKGCIGVGNKFVDLNKDGIPDMIESRRALESLVSACPDSFELEITMKKA